MDSCVIGAGMRLFDEEDGKHVLLRWEGDNAIDSLALKMLTHPCSPNFATFLPTEGEHAFRYVLEEERLDTLQEPWTRHSLAVFLAQLDKAIKEAEDHLLDPAMLLLHPHGIAFSGERAVFLPVPLLSLPPLEKSLSVFCQSILFLRGFEETDSACFATVFNTFRSASLSRNAIKTLLTHLQDERTAKEGTNMTAFDRLSSSTNKERSAHLPSEKEKMKNPSLACETGINVVEKQGQKNHPDWEQLSRYAERTVTSPSKKEQTAPILYNINKKESVSPTEPLSFPSLQKENKANRLIPKTVETNNKKTAKTPKTILDLLMHFSLENCKRYRNRNNDIYSPNGERKRKSPLAIGTTPLLWEENGCVRTIHLADAPRPHLRFSDKEEVDLSSLPIILGRGKEAGILRTNRQVSAKHARFSVENGQYAVTDCRSTNGTYVNNHRIPPFQPKVLARGDRLRFGEEEAIFLL